MTPALRGRLATGAESAVLAAGAFLVLLRFARLDLAPFIHDEPKLLLTSWDMLQSGDWATHSSLSASSTFAYGPVPMWFYAVAQAVIGRSALANITLMCTLVTASQVACVAAVASACAGGWQQVTQTSRGRWVLAAGLVFLGSMPYQHFWSRLAWELFANMGAFVAVALLARKELGPVASGLLGVVIGLAFASHPMFFPMGALAGLAGLLLGGPLKPKPLLARAVPMAVGFALVCLPWFTYLWKLPKDAVESGQHAQVTKKEWLVNALTPATARKISYFFDGEWPRFSQKLPEPVKDEEWSYWLTVLAGALALLGFAAHLRDERPGVRRLAWLGPLVAAAYPFFFVRLEVAEQPHYMFPTGWIPLVGAMLAIDLSFRVRWARLWPAIPLAVLVAVNLVALVAWRSDIAQREGTRGIHYGPVVGTQLQAMREVCRAPGEPIFLELHVDLFHWSILEHASWLPECGGRKVVVCRPGTCPQPGPGAAAAALVYAAPEGGRVSVVHVPTAQAATP